MPETTKVTPRYPDNYPVVYANHTGCVILSEEVYLREIEDSIGLETTWEVEAFERRVASMIGGDPGILARVARSNAPIDVRAIAAKLFASFAGRGAGEGDLKELTTHERPIVRLGVVLGLEAAKDTRGLEAMRTDADPRVREAVEAALAFLERSRLRR